MLSGDDRALKLSGILAGSKPRLGDYADAIDLESYGVTVVDLSKVKSTDRLNHTKFADNPVLVKLLGDRLKEDDGFVSDRDVTDRMNLLSSQN
jgi:esterase/lipase superfamily enzyme